MKPKRNIEDLTTREAISLTNDKASKRICKSTQREVRNYGYIVKDLLGRNGFAWVSDYKNYGVDVIYPASDFIAKKPKKASKKWVLEQIYDVLNKESQVKCMSNPIDYAARGIETYQDTNDIKVTDAETVGGDLEVGKWYVIDRNQDEDYALIRCQGETGYGFSHMSKFTDKYNLKRQYLKGYKIIPASPEQVKSALIKEAKRIGFKEGVKVIPVGYKNPQTIIFRDFNFSTVKNGLYLPSDESQWNINGISNPPIFLNGKWAEIIEQPKEIDFSVPGQLVTVNNNVWEVISDNENGSFMGILRIWDGELQCALHHGVSKLGMVKYTGEPIILKP